MQQAICIDQEFDFNARQARRHGRNPFQIKPSQRPAILRKLPFTLQHVDSDVGLTIDTGCEVFRRGCRDGGVALDDLCHHAAKGLNAKRQWRNVQQQHVFGRSRAAAQDVGLYGSAKCNHFIRIQFNVWLLAARRKGKQVIYECAYFGDPRGTPDHHHFINLFWLHTGIAQSRLAGLNGARDYRSNKLLKLLARDGSLIFPPVCECDVDSSRIRGGKQNLRIDYGLSQSLDYLGI